MAKTDERVVGAAVVGSLSVGPGDRWSDLDLTFSVSDEVEVDGVSPTGRGNLSPIWTRWSSSISRAATRSTAFSSAALPPDRPVVHSRVVVRPRGPRFRLLFGSAGEVSSPDPPDPRDLFGWAVVYARAARGYIARGRWWQAAHCISGVRDRTLALACIRRNLESGMAAATTICRRPSSIPCGFAGVVAGAGGAAGSAEGLGRRAPSRVRRSGRARNKGGRKPARVAGVAEENDPDGLHFEDRPS